jgi:hypothetical protein
MGANGPIGFATPAAEYPSGATWDPTANGAPLPYKPPEGGYPSSVKYALEDWAIIDEVPIGEIPTGEAPTGGSSPAPDATEPAEPIGAIGTGWLPKRSSGSGWSLMTA